MQVSSPHLNSEISFSKTSTKIVFIELIVENCGQDQGNWHLIYLRVFHTSQLSWSRSVFLLVNGQYLWISIQVELSSPKNKAWVVSKIRC